MVVGKSPRNAASSVCAGTMKTVKTGLAIPAGFNIDSYIRRLMSIGKPDSGLSTKMTEEEIMDLLFVSRNILMDQNMRLDLKPPVCIVGDVHGQFSDLMRIFSRCGFPHICNYLFLGDYVDRGNMSLEVILILLAFKVKYPANFFLLRGNHETSLVNKTYGFYDELVRRYKSPRLYAAFQDVFNCMPLTALIDDKILCMHGGLSPELYFGKNLNALNEIPRPLLDPPHPSLALDLLWADPDVSTEKFKLSNRGTSFTFGVEVINTVCQKHNLELICRAHQVVQDGYEFFANRKLVTIFSAPHYCGQFDNAAAILNVSKTLLCSFRVFRPKFPPIRIEPQADRER